MEQQARPPSAAPEGQFDSSSVTVTADHSPGASTRPAAPIVTLSEDPTLLEAISAAALDLVPVIVAPSADRFVDQVVASGGELALIDAAAIPDNLAQFLESVHRQFPALRLLLAGPGNVQHLIGAQMTDGTVYRFVHKPASAQRLRLFIDAALRERQTRITEEILRSPFAAADPTLRPARKPGRPGWAMAAVGLVLLIAAAGLVIWYSSTQRPSTTTAQAPVAPPPEKLRQPEPAAVSSPTPSPLPQSTAPASRPASPAALTEAEQAAVDRAAVERSERSEKERLVAEAEARQTAQAEQVRRVESDARLAQVHLLVQQARSRIASGALLEPANDSARSYVSQAQEQAPDEQEVRAVSVALGEALINSFRRALAAGDTTTAEEWLKACRSYQISSATLDQMAVQLEVFRAGQLAQNSAAKAVQNAPVAEAVVAPSTTPAAAPAAPLAAAPSGPKPVEASAQILQEGDLHRLEFNPPKYPPEALQRRQTGSVELDFTVTAAGTVSEIKVTKSNPIGVFEQASIAALVHNRYEPVQRDGVPVAQRAHIRMRFAL